MMFNYVRQANLTDLISNLHFYNHDYKHVPLDQEDHVDQVRQEGL